MGLETWLWPGKKWLRLSVRQVCEAENNREETLLVSPLLGSRPKVEVLPEARVLTVSAGSLEFGATECGFDLASDLKPQCPPLTSGVSPPAEPGPAAAGEAGLQAPGRGALTAGFPTRA